MVGGGGGVVDGWFVGSGGGEVGLHRCIGGRGQRWIRDSIKQL